MEFICVIDIQPSQTAWMADVILPETTYLERLDPIFAPPFTQKYMMARQPVVAPQYQSKTILEILQGISAELDKRHEFETKLSDAFNFTMEDYVDAQLKPQPMDRAAFLKEGIWVEPKQPVAFGKYRSGAVKFKTPSGKLEFVSERFRRNGYPVLPEYEPFKEQAGKQRLITGHMAQFTHSANQNNPWLNSLSPENEAWITPKLAQEKGISNGEYVRVRSDVGEVKIKALVTPKIRKDTVFIVHGFGSSSGGQTTSKGRGGADQVLMQSAADTISGNQAMHETFVEIIKA
jgi:thiosulfate reductase/polysulfide reductase chain A